MKQSKQKFLEKKELSQNFLKKIGSLDRAQKKKICIKLNSLKKK